MQLTDGEIYPSLPPKRRPMPSRIPRGAFVLPLDVIGKLGSGNPVLGEELVELMFGLGAPTARVLRPEVVADIGHGDLNAGRKVLQQFVALVRRRDRAAAE